MIISKKIKTVDNKVEQMKDQCDLDKQTAKISALSPGNVSKYEFLTSKDVLPEKRLVRKSCYNEKIWIFSARQRIKTHTDIAKDYYKLFKDQMNVNNNNREEDTSDENMNDEIGTAKKFDAILKYMKNIGLTTKSRYIKVMVVKLVCIYWL